MGAPNLTPNPHATEFRARIARVLRLLGAVALLGGAVPLASVGCVSDRREGERITITSDESQRFERAHALSQRAEQTKDPASAIRLYREAVTIFPELASAWNNLGVLLMDQQNYMEAAIAFVSAAESAPADPRPLYNLGLTWERAGYSEDAFKYYRQALERDRRYLPALRGAIRAERVMGRGDDRTLERLRLALLQETDEQWRDYFQRQRAAVEDDVYRRPGARRQGDAAEEDTMYSAPPRTPREELLELFGPDR